VHLLAEAVGKDFVGNAVLFLFRLPFVTGNKRVDRHVCSPPALGLDRLNGRRTSCGALNSAAYRTRYPAPACRLRENPNRPIFRASGVADWLHTAGDFRSFSATAARMSALNARSLIMSPSWISMARRVLPSRLELKRPDGSGSEAPLAK